MHYVCGRLYGNRDDHKHCILTTNMKLEMMEGVLECLIA